MPTQSRQPHLPALTGLRALAALHVFAFHVLGPRLTAAGSAGWPVRLVERGYVAVSLFFVLSGFILGRVYLRTSGSHRVSAEEFWWARAARVGPLYLLALVVAIPLFAITSAKSMGTDWPAVVATAITTPLGLQAWTPWTACRWNCPGWSLSVEAFFYALFPVIGVALCRVRPATRWLVAVATWGAGLALVGAYIWLSPSALATAGPAAPSVWREAIQYSPAAHLGEFVVGMVLGLSFSEQMERHAPRWAGLLAAGTFVTVVALLAAVERAPYLLLHNGGLVPLWCAMIVGLAWQRGSVARVLSHPVAVWLGERSFALYLLHLPVFAYLLAAAARVPSLGRLSTGPWIALVLAVSLLAAAAAYAWVEEPARRAIRAYARTRRDASSVTSPPRSPAVRRAA